MIDSFDYCIIGGGTAGATAAIMLKKRAPQSSILMIEASNYDEWRVGETLSPDAGRAFRELGIWDSFNHQGHLASYGTCAAWEHDYITENEFIYHPEGKGWHLNRVKFDEWMAGQAAGKGIVLRKQTRYISHKQQREGFLLNLEHSKEKYQVQANWVIDASGRLSAFGRNEKVQRTVYDRLSGVIGFFKSELPPEKISTYTLVESQKEGWWYSAYLNDDRFIIAFMTDSDILKAKGLQDTQVYLNLLKETLHTQHRVLKLTPLDSVRILSAASILSQTVYGHRWIAIGDAASTFDPLSSQGIYKGIRSGMFSAYAILDEQAGKSGLDKYQRFISDEYKEYLETKKEFYSRVQRWPNSEFWKRRR